MYDLPENPTAIDIIKRSVTCHPSMFADMLRARMNIAAKAMYQAHLQVVDAILDECTSRGKTVLPVPMGEE